MRYASSALKRCSDSLSSSAKTATVRFPISFAARITRMAISPRLAMRILRNSAIGALSPRWSLVLAAPRRWRLVGFVKALRNRPLPRSAGRGIFLTGRVVRPTRTGEGARHGGEGAYFFFFFDLDFFFLPAFLSAGLADLPDVFLPAFFSVALAFFLPPFFAAVFFSDFFSSAFFSLPPVFFLPASPAFVVLPASSVLPDDLARVFFAVYLADFAGVLSGAAACGGGGSLRARAASMKPCARSGEMPRTCASLAGSARASASGPVMPRAARARERAGPMPRISVSEDTAISCL